MRIAPRVQRSFHRRPAVAETKLDNGHFVGSAQPFLSGPLVRAACDGAYPAQTLSALRRRLRLLWNIEKNRHWLETWLQHDDRALIRKEIERHPAVLGLTCWPFIHAGWPIHRRFKALSVHLQVVDSVYPWLDFKGQESRFLMDLGGIEPGVHLRLDWPAWFYREGGVTFNLFLDDHRLMSIPFAFGLHRNEVVVYVGGLQGSNREGAKDVYRDLTKTVHGLRPRDFVLRLFRKFVSALSIKMILLVDDEHRNHRHPYFRNQLDSKLFFSYDDVWAEHGGRKLLGTGFSVLFGDPQRTPLKDVPTRKRAMYKRRYELLDSLVDDLHVLVLNAQKERK